MASSSTLPLKDLIKPHIHHEKQEAGSMLCAQHALNNLLQGNYFDAAQLADIATQLDALERDNLEMSDADWNNREAAGRNADETGFFSVTVLETALQVWGLSLVRWASAETQPYRNAPEEQLAFVLNLQNHWFCFRSFGPNGSLWYNLNSFLPEPSWVGSKFLGALLDQSQTEGYSVFVIRPSSEDERDNVETQFRGSVADQMVAQEPGQGDMNEDAAIEEAIRASLAGNGSAAAGSSSSSGPRVPSASATEGSSLGGSSGKRRRSKRQGDEDLQAALAASMKTAGPSRAGAFSSQGGTADTAISLEDDDDDNDRDALGFDASTSAQPSRSPFLNPALRDQIIEGIDTDEELDEMQDIPGATGLSSGTARRGHAGHLGEPIEIDSDEDADADADDFDSWRASAAAFQNMRDRDYDDEDAELQRALALSMDEGAGGHGRGQSSDKTDDLDAADPDEQARILAQILKARERRSPTPADVGRIAKMREEAKRKEEEERARTERRERGVFTPEPEPAKKARTDGDEEEEEEEDEAEGEQTPLSPEELRKMRLARFGGS